MKKIVVLSGLISFCSYASQGQSPEETQTYKYLKEAQDFHNSCRHLIVDFQDHEIKETPSCELSGTMAKGISWLIAAVIASGAGLLATSVGADGLKSTACAASSALTVQQFLHDQLYVKRSPQGVLMHIDKLVAQNEATVNDTKKKLDKLPFKLSPQSSKEKSDLEDYLSACRIVLSEVRKHSKQYPNNPHIKRIDDKCREIVSHATLTKRASRLEKTSNS